jgi:hypothetical protein
MFKYPALMYPVYWHLIEQREAEIREREQWIEDLAVKWGLVRSDDSAGAGLNR